MQKKGWLKTILFWWKTAIGIKRMESWSQKTDILRDNPISCKEKNSKSYLSFLYKLTSCFLIIYSTNSGSVNIYTKEVGNCYLWLNLEYVTGRGSIK